MKNFILTLLFSVIQIFSIAQKDSIGSKPFPYLYAGVGAGTRQAAFTARWLVSTTSQKGWGACISGQTVNAGTVPYPSGYQSGSLGLGFSGSNDGKQNLTQFINLRGIKEWNIPSSKLRWGVEAGPSFVKSTQYSFVPIDNGGGGFFGTSRTHNMEENTQNAVGLSLRCKALLPFIPWLGVEAAAVGSINSISNYFGLECHLLLGKVGNSKP